ncbi:MAG: peptidyl-prolyl cis-trans isomerase [Candidatus Marinimicrobia bacterium]|nr:peptidyl-prolyl cis-trans isomerase [Candidatus Neomarinimicrobiota bacterium]
MFHCEREIENKIVIQLNREKAPVTVENFLTYCNEGFYEGTIFHRVIDGFMIQGGGHTADMTEKPTHAPIKNEANNGLSNKRGTIAMARTNDPHSATAQFYINVVDNDRLDYSESQGVRWGYCVFGEVIEGMDVVDRIKITQTKALPGGMRDVPVYPITIQKVKVKGDRVTLGISFGASQETPQ